MNSNGTEPHEAILLTDPELIQSVTRKKEDLLQRLHKLSDRVKTLDSRAQEMSEAEAQTVSPKHSIPAKQGLHKEPIQTIHRPQPKPTIKSQYEPAVTHQTDIDRNLKSIQALLNGKHYLNEDYRKSIGQLNDIQGRTKLMYGKIDKACDLIKKLDSDSKYAPDSKHTMQHLFEQLGVCLHGKPSAQTLSQLREEYDVVVSPYFS